MYLNLIIKNLHLEQDIISSSHHERNNLESETNPVPTIYNIARTDWVNTSNPLWEQQSEQNIRQHTPTFPFGNWSLISLVTGWLFGEESIFLQQQNTLLKSVLSALPIYFLSAFKCPRKVIDSVERIEQEISFRATWRIRIRIILLNGTKFVFPPKPMAALVCPLYLKLMRLFLQSGCADLAPRIMLRRSPC